MTNIMTNKKNEAIIKDLFIRCKKIKYFTCIYHSVLFFCSKRCEIKFNTLFDYQNQQQKRITKYCYYSADIDSKDFVKVYREYTKEPYSFLTINTILPASNPLRFEKNLLPPYKNVTDENTNVQ